MVDDHAQAAGDNQPIDVAVAAHQADAAIEGTPVDANADALRGGSRHQEPGVVVAAPVSAEPVTYVAVEASATTDPHHDQGSAATGHVEDATPDTHAAGPAVEEEKPEEVTPPPEPAHEEPATPAPEPAAEHHDDTTAATPDADHTT